MNTRTKSVQSRLDKKNYERLVEIANEKGVTVSLLVRIILLKFLWKENRDV